MSTTLNRVKRRLRNGNLPDSRAVARQIARAYYRGDRPYNTDGTNVFDEDWDNLLILDACRYDAFAEEADLPGTLESRTSRGSMTREWVRGNFSDRKLYDTVYVTGNGNFDYVRDKIGADIHAEVPLWRDEHRTGAGKSITPPETVAEATLRCAEEYPTKRIVGHFVQPHTPYLGPTGERFDPRVPLKDIPRRYDVSVGEIARAYRENLSLVLEEVETLVAELPGKTVVTADHGELLGDRLRPVPVRDYGHPDGIYMDELVTVPWHVSINGDRKDIVSERPETATEVDVDEVKAHLRDLGYAT
ncbi:alkaline phosphatase family protein [Halegenticoccus soli]|uniref:hypothetical protein n=1 Tax=Halegenticoccus soli TaxID=1985678 RepID=UPI0018EA368D|nr:hypothetical protein [Halegenticoccus soli]